MLITGDLHLGLKHKNTPMIDLGAGAVSTHTCATLTRFHSLCKYAEKNGNRDIVLLGDIFHTPYPDAATLAYFVRVLHLFSESLWFHIIPGNHDCASETNSTDSVRLLAAKFGSVSVYTYQQGVMLDGGMYEFVPHAGYGKPFELQGRAFDVLFGHGQLEGIQIGAFELESTGSAMSLSRDAAALVNRVFLGHIHVKTIEKDGHVHVTYPGSLFPCTFGEIKDKKGFWDMKKDTFVPFTVANESTFSVFQDTPIAPHISLGIADVKDGRVRMKWGSNKPRADSMKIIKVNEVITCRDALRPDWTRKVLRNFSDRGICVSSYDRVFLDKQERPSEVESIKGNLNHQEVFDAYVDANYKEHKYYKLIKMSGRKMLEGV